MAPDLISTREACRLLGDLPLSTFHSWVDAEKITPALKANGKRGQMFFRRSDVQRLAAKLGLDGAA